MVLCLVWIFPCSKEKPVILDLSRAGLLNYNHKFSDPCGICTLACSSLAVVCTLFQVSPSVSPGIAKTKNGACSFGLSRFTCARMRKATINFYFAPSVYNNMLLSPTCVDHLSLPCHGTQHLATTFVMLYARITGWRCARSLYQWLSWIMNT